jgi:hypothetical protein
VCGWLYVAGVIALCAYAIHPAAFDTRTGDLGLGWLGVVGFTAAGVVSAGRAVHAWGRSRPWLAIHSLQAVLGVLFAILFLASLPD